MANRIDVLMSTAVDAAAERFFLLDAVSDLTNDLTNTGTAERGQEFKMPVELQEQVLLKLED